MTKKNSPEKPTPEELARRAIRGDEKAFEQIITTYEGAFYRICYSFLRERDSAEDAFQEGTLKFWLQLCENSSYDISRPLLPWAYSIYRTSALDVGRKRASWERRATPISRLAVMTSDGNPNNNGSTKMLLETPREYKTEEETQERKKFLKEKIEKIERWLSVERSQGRTGPTCLDLSVRGLSYKAIAIALNIPEGTVKSAIHTAREEIEQFIGYSQENI